MPTFDTPEPITAEIDVVVGDVRIDAGDRATASVDVQPSDASNQEDVKAAELTRVEHSGGHLVVKAPKLRSWRPRSTGGSIDVTIELPAGSALHASGQLTDFRCDGPAGVCRIKTGIGRIAVDRAATVVLKVGAGDIAVEHVTGDAEITTGSGEIRARELDGAAVVKNSNGDTWIGLAHGDVRLKAANGSVAIDVAEAGVSAKTANGDVRLGEVARGSIVLETHLGELEVGVREGSAAWLDVRAAAGRLHNALDASSAPGSSDEKVEIRARTSLGDVVVRRAERTGVAS
jgi:DUF4097 and DUF4098 domain-containing protein YvlB